jgi:hypothetical protein
MSQYFDETFFKFFFGFLTIIFISLSLLFATQYFENKSNERERASGEPEITETVQVNF